MISFFFFIFHFTFDFSVVSHTMGWPNMLEYVLKSLKSFSIFRDGRAFLFILRKYGKYAFYVQGKYGRICLQAGVELPLPLRGVQALTIF